jgi:hypothetical protein
VQSGLTATTSQNFNSGTSNTVYIGANSSGNGIWQGYISNLRVIVGTAIYTSAFTPPTAPFATGTTNQQLLVCAANNFTDINTATSAKTITVVTTPSVQAFSPFAPTAAYSASVVGGSSYGNAATDYLNFTDSGNLLDLGGAVASFECWYYPIASSAFQNIFLKASAFTWSTTNGIEYAISLNSGAFTITYNASGTPTALADPTAKAINQWYHLVVATDASNNISLFVNGVRVANATNAITKPTTRTNMYVGAIGSGSEFSKGYISGVSFIKGSGAYNAASTTITVPTAPPTVITNTALLLNYTNAGIFDSAAKNVLETVGNAQVSTTQAKWGTTSMYFDGNGDYLTAPNSNLYAFQTGDLTIEMWVYPSTVSVAQYLIDTRDPASGASAGIQWFVDASGKLGVYLGTSSIIAATTGSISANTWTHLALVKNGSTWKFYINGTADATTGTNSTAITQGFMTIACSCNQKAATTTDKYTGYIDDLRISRFARYTANFTAPTAAFSLQ